MWKFEKYLIGQFEGYEYVANQEQASLEKRKEASYKLTNLRIYKLCNFKSFFFEFDKYYYEFYDSTENQETYINYYWINFLTLGINISPKNLKYLLDNLLSLDLYP